MITTCCIPFASATLINMTVPNVCQSFCFFTGIIYYTSFNTSNFLAVFSSEFTVKNSRSMAHVFNVSTPFQVGEMVICFIAVFMIHKRLVFRVFDKQRCNKSVRLNSLLNAIY